MSDPNQTTERDDDLFWEEWLSLSDAQRDAIVDREMAEYSRWFSTLTPIQQYRHRRKRNLETCLGWRRTLRRMDIPVIREHLRRTQRLLLKLRAEFYYGVKGEA
ncbi:MAG TPA: hypothetical protein VFL96_04135 [Acidobacteriaceae bacterium]|nr:hypothetical protein [Acidobacteriaceae bacterium]